MNLSRNSNRGKHSIDAFTTDRHRQRRGISLVEVMLAVLILVIAVIGVSSSFVSGRRFVVSQRQYQVAAQIASQRFEELKTLGYDNIEEGEDEEEISFEGQTYLRQTQIEMTEEPSAEVPKPCKKVTVIIEWSLYGRDRHQANLVTYIGP